MRNKTNFSLNIFLQKPFYFLNYSWIIILLIIILAPLPAMAHSTSAYTHKGGTHGHNPAWIAGLWDNLHLSSMSIPGTHDSMSLHVGAAGDAAQTQSMSLRDQLESGIRALDIRCRRTGSKFAIHHGPVYLDAMFGDVLHTAVQFLKEYPSETILMRVKEEHDPKAGSKSFSDIFNGYWNNPEFKPYLWENPIVNGATPLEESWGNKNGSRMKNPKLWHIRGKIVILRDFSGEDNQGLSYKSFHVQDEYTLPKGFNVADGINWKWQKVLKEMGLAIDSSDHSLHINYLSATGLSGEGVESPAFPYTIASGHGSSGDSAARLWSGKFGSYNGLKDFPRLGCTDSILDKVATKESKCIYAEGVNILTWRWINKRGKLGLMMADFPGKGLIGKIIDQNSHTLDKSAKASFWNNGRFGPPKSISFKDIRGFGPVPVRTDAGYNTMRMMADVNGDGKADFCRIVGNRGKEFVWCATSQGNQLKGSVGSKKAADIGYNDQMRMMADVNGDGKADFCRIVGNRGKEFLSCLTSKGSKLEGSVNSKSPLDLGYRTMRMMADVNGDGKADYCRVVGNRGKEFVRCELSTGNGFNGAVSSYKAGIDLGYKDQMRMMADVNGDGKADYCRVVGGKRIQCSLSDGKKIGPRAVWSRKGTDLGYKNRYRFMKDINGDGMADYCRTVGAQTNKVIGCELSNGSSFSGNIYTPHLTDMDHRIWFLGDLNGDGHSDLISVYVD